jgi:hypothetical protein
MTIHLICDASSLPTAQFLTTYIPKFFLGNLKVQLHSQRLDPCKYWTWTDLFVVGKAIKSSKKVNSKNDFFILLIAGENEYNWFSAYDESDPTVAFIQTTGWEFCNISKPNYAVAYHLITILTAMKFHGDNPTPYDFYHSQSVGCMFDFTGFKQDVIYKLKSAHICPSCVKSIAMRAPQQARAFAYLKSVKDLLEDVRDHLFKIEWDVFFKNYDYRLQVKEDLSLVLEVDGEHIPVPISRGRETAIFIMLLKYQNGLTYRDFEKPRFKKEYIALYHRYFVNNSTFSSLMKQADLEIEQKTYKNNLQINISRIKKKLAKTLKQYPSIQDSLLIQNKKGQMIIPINRTRLVSSVPELQNVG